jgi:hypothetical protein
MEFNVVGGGKQEVIVVLTKANDFGIVQLAIDGKDLGKGKHVLRATVNGSNDKAKNSVGTGSRLFGLDYLRLNK